MPRTYIRNVLVLAGGIGVAQLIPILASPLLTRLYTPVDFGLFAVFTAIIISLEPLVCGRYEIAMLLPKSNRHGKEIFAVSLWIACLVTLVAFALCLLALEILHEFPGVNGLGGWLLLVPVGLFLTGFFNLNTSFANRTKEYKLIAKTKTLQALLMVGTSILLGFMGIGFPGLLIGGIVGLLIAGTFVFRRNDVGLNLLGWTLRKFALLKKYREYPLYNSTTSLLDGITVSLPVFFLIHYFPEAVAGYYLLVMRGANAPLSFISAAVSQVTMKKMIELKQEGIKTTPYIYSATLGLTLIVLLPGLVIILFAPEIFAFVFGKEWTEAGIYAQIIMPAIMVRFVSSSLSTTLWAMECTRYAATWKVIAFVATLAVLLLYAPSGEILGLLKALVVNDIVLYLFYYVLIVMASRKPQASV